MRGREQAGAVPGSMRRGPRSFHLKDVFTLVNMVSGVLAVRYVLLDEPRRAAYAVIAGYLFGDLLDGAVARLTHTSNRFGAELDSIVDHFVHVVVPGLIIYTVYADADHGWLGLATMGVLLSFATVRHARQAAARFDYPLCWCGLPRTASGFAAMALPLSHLFAVPHRSDYWLGFGVISFLALLNLMPIPYMTHRGRRAMQPSVRAAVALGVVTPIITFLLFRSYTFDVCFFWVVCYAATGWLPVHPEERRSFYEEYRRYRSALAL